MVRKLLLLNFVVLFGLKAGNCEDISGTLNNRFNDRQTDFINGLPNQPDPNAQQKRHFNQQRPQPEGRPRQPVGGSIADAAAALLQQGIPLDQRGDKSSLDEQTKNFVNEKNPPAEGEPPLCGPFPQCAQSKFRTIDGFCNNLQNPNQGRAALPFNRWLPAQYADGCSSPRVESSVPNILPNAREVSKLVHEMTSMESDSITHMVMQWGQFLDHDITFTPVTVADSDGAQLTCDCANPDGDCFNIALQSADDLFSPNGGCISFARSAAATPCEISCREQENGITAYIDASNVYGSSFDVMQNLRGSGGRLKVQDGADVLPTPPGACPIAVPAPTCSQYLPNSDPAQTDSFIAGDVRVTEQVGLTAMHTVWLREHNLVVQVVETVFGGLNSDQKFEEARRFIGAIHQHITYSQFLPAILGSANAQAEGLTPRANLDRTSYDPSCDATIMNEFATAAYRFGHSLIRSLLKMVVNGDFNNPGVIENLANHYEDPAFLMSSFPRVDEILLGMSEQKAEDNDRFVTEAVRDRLFAGGSSLFGLDLAALNIQRGRDHGLQSYLAYRAHFGLPAPSGLADTAVFKDAALASAYQNLNDVDLFVGMLAEKPKAGAIVGPLLYAMLVDQFRRLKNCDRYYYEHQGVFQNDELDLIKRESLAKVLCRQLPSIQTIQPNVFLVADASNQRVGCSTLLADSRIMQILAGGGGGPPPPPPPPPPDGGGGGGGHHGGGGGGGGGHHGRRR